MEGSPRAYAEYFRINLWVRPTSIGYRRLVFRKGKSAGISHCTHAYLLPHWPSSVEDDFGGRASPSDYIESFEAFVRANMNAAPALIAATQKPRELTRKELKALALLLDENGFSEASLRQAYGRVRNADIAAHIIGFVRQAAIGDPLVPYETRVENGVQRIIASRAWTPKQKQWLVRKRHESIN
jgi:hypothetical protein